MADDLMFQSVGELAASVREGDISARELVETSLEAIGRLNGDVNAFVTLCEERALAEADAVQPGDAARWPACRSRSRTWSRSPRACARRWAWRRWRTGCRRSTAPSYAGCAAQARSSWARPTPRRWASCPSPSRSGSGRPATPGTPHARRAAPPAAAPRPWPRGWSRSRTATTAADRSAFRLHAAGSSASSPAAAECRSRPSSASSRGRSRSRAA